VPAYLFAKIVPAFQYKKRKKETDMELNVIGLVAVILSLGIPIAGMYTFYRVRKLRTEERLAVLARGENIPMEPELSQAARSRRAGILLVSGSIGYMVAFGLIARILGEPETLVAATFGLIPLAIGIGYFVDFSLVRRDLRAS
jgi:hypothetical protein